MDRYISHVILQGELQTQLRTSVGALVWQGTLVEDR